MRKAIISSILIFITFSVFGQKNGIHGLSLEIIPLGHQYVRGEGLHVNYEYEQGKICHVFSLGHFFSDFNSTHSAQYTNFSDDPGRWSTDIDYEINEDFPFLAPFYLYEELQHHGFYQMKPKLDYRLNRYLSYELLYKLIDKRFRVLPGMGITAGLTNRSYTIYGLDGRITGNISDEEYGEFWITINARAKYLYYGLTGKLVMDYLITDRFSAGITGGFQAILNREFESDTTVFYLGLKTKVYL
jgi:hypothetical protein